MRVTAERGVVASSGQWRGGLVLMVTVALGSSMATAHPPLPDGTDPHGAVLLQAAPPTPPATAPATPPAGPPATTTAAPDALPWQAESFSLFRPGIAVRADAHFLWIESDGLPHEPLAYTPMVGITAWQQQVPLPQAYTGANAWRIPLKPELAQTPIDGRTSLRRGAIALAANGVPIFNALNNRGEDAYLAGELDRFGGHCGRGDDYHYHAAPLFLQEIVGTDQPIAFALDGFAIYGLFDARAKPGSAKACPLGSTDPLDALGGHFCTVPEGRGIEGTTRGYHYHASTKYPYINGGMKGKVAVENDGIEPQPRAQPIRPALPPLKDAKIVGFKATGPKAWTLTYTIRGKKGRVEFAATAAGGWEFTFVGTDGTKRTETFAPPRSGDAPPRNGDAPPRSGDAPPRPGDPPPRKGDPPPR